MEAGRLLESICDTLSWTFAVRIHRKQGDRYTLGELWPPVRKALKDSSVARTTDTIDLHLHLRNLLGAHYNSWAESVSLGEARELGRAIAQLLAGVYCVSCRSWISGGESEFSCRCGAVVLAMT
jgi:hypothetical protein